MAVLTTSFGKILIYQLFAAVKLKQREKNVVLVASPLRMLSMIKLKQWFFKTILHQNIKYLLNCNYQLCANLLSNFAFTNTFNSGWDLTIKCNHITFITALLLVLNNRLQLVVLQHESQASGLLIF